MGRKRKLEGCGPSQPIPSRHRGPGALQVRLFLLILGAILLVLCARGDLWLDEIWSFEWAERADSPWDILRIFPHDNNHPLNSWWLMAVGTGSAPLVCRALSIVCGLSALLLVGRLAASLAPSSRTIATVLAVFSFPLVLYFSEARGYAPAVACALAAAVILVETRARPPVLLAVLFWLVCAIGMLSHATFLLVLTALAAWKMISMVDEMRSPLPVLFASMRWFFVPGLGAVFLYVGFLRRLQIGGGPEYSLTTVLGHFFSYALGFPVGGPWTWLAIGTGGLLYGAGIWFGLRHARVSHIGWLFVFLPVTAAVGLVVSRPEVLYFRYFLVFLPFFYLALAALLARLAGMGAGSLAFGVRRWSAAAAIVVALLVAYVVAQAPRLYDLVTLGRGSYREALRHVALSPFANKVVTSDHDARNKVLVEFFARRDPLSSRVKYLPLAESGSGRAGWLLRHSQASSQGKPEQFMHTPTETYRYVGVFPHAGVSGWHWLLYRSVSAGTPFMTKMSQGGSPSLR